MLLGVDGDYIWAIPLILCQSTSFSKCYISMLNIHGFILKLDTAMMNKLYVKKNQGKILMPDDNDITAEFSLELWDK